MRHRAVALAMLLWAVTITTVHAIWPTTCVEANDAFERDAGRHENVGIYQRVFGDEQAAEAACRRDHRDDIRATFWWAFQDGDSAPQSPPTTNPPTPDSTFNQVRAVAIARGAGESFARWIANDVIARSTVDAFLRGQDEGVQYGQYDCEATWRSQAACPLAPATQPTPAASSPSDRPSPTPIDQFHVDPALADAWRMLTTSETGTLLIRRLGTQPLSVKLDSRVPDHAFAGYYSEISTIGVGRRVLSERTAVIAVMLSHELWHAVSPIPRPRDFDGCVADEVWAFVTQGIVWQELLGDSAFPVTDFELAMWSAYDVLRNSEWGALDFDRDVQDWQDMLYHVLFDRNYVELCVR